MNEPPERIATRPEDYHMRPAWQETSVERRDYLDLLGDYIPRGQKHFKLKRQFGIARLSSRSMLALQSSARAGDTRALSLLAGRIVRNTVPVS